MGFSPSNSISAALPKRREHPDLNWRCALPSALVHSQVTVHSPDEKETVPLSIHHLPLALTFACFAVRPRGCEGVQHIARGHGSSSAVHCAAVLRVCCAHHKWNRQQCSDWPERPCCAVIRHVDLQNVHMPLFSLRPPPTLLTQHGEIVALDPVRKEEAAQSGRMTVVANVHGEVCAVQKLDGVPLSPAMVRLCVTGLLDEARELATQPSTLCWCCSIGTTEGVWGELKSLKRSS